MSDVKQQDVIEIETTTLWDYSIQNYGQKKHGDNKYNGVTPAFVVWNLLKRYTKEGDLVVDPMCGSGTTIDVANELKRNVIGYDLNFVRKDVIYNDSRQIPLLDNRLDFVFIDPPYSNNIKYSNSTHCLGNYNCEDSKYFMNLEIVILEIYRIIIR